MASAMPRLMAHLIAAGIWTWMTLISFGGARAQTIPSLDLRWHAPWFCPDADWVRERLSLHFERNTMSDARVVVLEANVAASGASFQANLRVTTGGATSERSLSSNSCEQLADAVALVAAFALDAAQDVEVEPAPPSASVPRAPAVSPQQPPALRQNELRLRVLSSLRLGVGLGALPHASTNLAFEVGVHYWRLQLRAGIDVLLPSNAYASGSTTLGGQFSRLAFTARLGVNLLEGDFTLAPYVGAEIGRIHGEGIGISKPESAQAAWNAAVVGIALACRIASWLALELDAHAELPAARYQFEIEQIGALYVPSPVTFAMQAGFTARFP